MAQCESHIEARQRQAFYHFLEVIELGLLGAQELTPRRGIEEQIAHLYCRATGVGRRLELHLHFAALTGGTAALTTVFIGVTGEC